MNKAIHCFLNSLLALGLLAVVPVQAAGVRDSAGGLPAVRTTPGEAVQSLDGPWQFTIVSGQAAGDGTGWDTISVPGNWDTLPQYSTHSGKGWYRRTFTAGEALKGKSVRLRFEAVNHNAEVTLNGKVLGSHAGGQTPFEFDVTQVIRFGAENTLVVCADNSYRRGMGAWWLWGGISRSVNLIANEPVRIAWQHIRSEPDLAAGTAAVFVRYRLVNTSSTAQAVQLASVLDDAGVPLITRQATVPANGVLEVEGTANVAKVRLWHFDHPNLYRLTTRVSAGGKVQHERSDRFGIRKIELRPDAFLLNGEPMRLVGFNRISDEPTLGNTEPDSLVKKDVALMKRAGAVMSRLMHYAQAPNLLDELDTQGMMIIAEIPFWGVKSPKPIDQDPFPRQLMAEMIERDYNHPCIIGWSVGNEMHDHRAYADSMMTAVRKELDPHRLVTFASMTSFAPEGPIADPFENADLVMSNHYSNFLASVNRQLDRWPDKPIFLSEIGKRQLKEDGKLAEGFFAEWAKLTPGNPRIIGASLWSFNDYRSSYKGTGPNGFRTWGVVDEHHNPKPAYAQIRALFSPVRNLAVAGRTVTVEVRHRDEIPSYALRGYRLAWGPAGQPDQEDGRLALPDLTPGAPAWTGTLPVNLPAGTEVRLVTPTGFDVAAVLTGK